MYLAFPRSYLQPLLGPEVGAQLGQAELLQSMDTAQYRLHPEGGSKVDLFSPENLENSHSVLDTYRFSLHNIPTV